MKKFIVYAVRVFGLKGSWKWALKKMLQGEIIYRTTDTGAAKYRFSRDEQDRLEWAFEHHITEFTKWNNAYFFFGDILCTTWDVFKNEE